MIIYTNVSKLDGTGWDYVGAEVDGFPQKIIPVGEGYEVLVIRNPVRRCWHAAELRSGIIIATDVSEFAVLRNARRRDLEIMKELVRYALEWAKSAKIIPADDLFYKFRNFLTR